MNIELYRQSSYVEFHENPSNGSRVVPCGRTDGWTDRRTDMTKLIVAFRNFTNARKKLLFDKSLLFIGS